MLILRIKQAQTALADGRLDEAFALANDPELRSHKRGQDLIGALAEALVARGRSHLHAGRTEQSVADARKARHLAGNREDLATLEADLAAAHVDRQAEEATRDDLLSAAREQIRAGRLSVGRDLLDEADRPEHADSVRVRHLRRDIRARQGSAESDARKIRQALTGGDWPAAAALLVSVGAADQPIGPLNEALAETRRAAADEIRRALRDGRLDKAELLWTHAAGIAARRAELAELHAAALACRRAAEWIAGGHPRHAARALQQAATVLDEPAWLTEAIKQTRLAAEAMEQLAAGPLGMVAPDEEPFDAPPRHQAGKRQPDPFAAPRQVAPRDARPTPDGPNQPGDGHRPRRPHQHGKEAPDGDASTRRLPERFLLQVDAAGSFAVLRNETVRIGPISSSDRPDLGLMVDPSAPTIDIERVDEDYFLRCEREISVNGQPVRRRLLTDGDKIALSRRCRLTFRRPNAASSSAVLEVSGARLPAGGARRVILMDREIILSTEPTAHVQAEVTAPAVLHVRDDRLACRTDAPVTIGERPIDPAEALPLDTPVRVGGVGLVAGEL